MPVAPYAGTKGGTKTGQREEQTENHSPRLCHRVKQVHRPQAEVVLSEMVGSNNSSTLTTKQNVPF